MHFKKLYACLAILFISSAALSQRVYFLYIQTENKQNFFVKIKEKTYTSSAAGYVVIPKLIDSTYTLNIGIVGKNENPSVFSVTMNKKDHGFLLKNFEGKGWGLFDLQTLEVKMSSASASQNTAGSMASAKEVPAFTEGLSKASGDPSLKERPSTASKPVETKTPPLPDNEIVKDNQAVPTTNPTESEKKVTIASIEPAKKKEEPNVIVEPVKETGTIKIEPLEKVPETNNSVTTTSGLQGAIDSVKEKKEEVVEILKETPSMPTEVVNKDVTDIQVYKSSLVKKKSESSTTEGFGLTYVDTYPSGQSDTIKLIIPNPKTPQAVITTLDTKADSDKVIKCMLAASDEDFLQLRKLMASANGDDAMITEAKKSFLKICYSTLQVKNLGTLFLSDAAKYQFFDAAYEYTKDVANFASLEAELKDEYYIKRFKALLRN
jgi:hypothetical protein